MFNCYTHGWTSEAYPCRECFPPVVNKDENKRLREALEWMVRNEHLTLLIDEPEHVADFMSRARDALEGKASE